MRVLFRGFNGTLWLPFSGFHCEVRISDRILSPIFRLEHGDSREVKKGRTSAQEASLSRKQKRHFEISNIIV